MSSNSSQRSTKPTSLEVIAKTVRFHALGGPEVLQFEDGRFTPTIAHRRMS
jgi:hypothetical protein